MGIATRFGIQGLQPIVAPEFVLPQVASLPYGGPTGSITGLWPQGQALGYVQVAAQNEVATLTLGGTPTGGTFTASFNGYQTAAIAYNATTAAFQAALVAAIPEWSGNVTVTGTAGASYVVTFNTQLASQRIGGLFGVNVGSLTSGTTATGSWARTTRGSCGLAQADAYSQASNNFVDAFLKYDTYLSPGGAQVAPGLAGGLVAAGQPFQPAVYEEGIFLTADLVGLDANAYTLGKLTKMKGGLRTRLI